MLKRIKIMQEHDLKGGYSMTEKYGKMWLEYKQNIIVVIQKQILDMTI